MHMNRPASSSSVTSSSVLVFSVCSAMFQLLFIIWNLFLSRFSVSTYPYAFLHHANHEFLQKTDRFWKFQEETKSWVELKLPYDLVSCVNGNCTKVGSIERTIKIQEQEEQERVETRDHMDGNDQESVREKEKSDTVLRQRRRISITKMSATSIWITGESGSIYERFWNGVQWVIAPHDLPVPAGPAMSIFVVNQTILALSESGNLYQIQLSENSQPAWVEFMPIQNQSAEQETEQDTAIKIKTGVVSHDARKAYFCTKDGMLLELVEVEPPRWINHGRPPGADVATIADVANIREDVIFTISSTGILYEYERSSRPPWKKHLRREEKAEDTSLVPLLGCALHGLIGEHSVSLFLLTKGGSLVERRLHQRKWKWIIHGHPGKHYLTSITPALQDEQSERVSALFFTTSTGLVLQYQMLRNVGATQRNDISNEWINHMHPRNAKAARGNAGLPYQVGRILFPLDDGRLAELHLTGQGGEHFGPIESVNRRKVSTKYVWTILDAPESEGWNAEYCIEERGPSNCITGIKDEPNDSGIARTAVSRRRKGTQAQENYLPQAASLVDKQIKGSETHGSSDKEINAQYRLRVASEGRSFFLVTSDGLTFEYLNAENVWFWLKHDHSTPMKGALGNYNGSLFLVDAYGTLLTRERNVNELTWINCTALKKGRQIIGGPPWDIMPRKAMLVTAEDALFFVSRNGRLLQFTVALRKFEWKDCKHPPKTKVMAIVDQELFRKNIVFVIGSNGRLYQYNKVTELWHEHHQSQHLVLSQRPGTAMRPSPHTLTGSLFMLSEDGGLVEYHWNARDGWIWVEHGIPSKSVTIVCSTGPWFEGNQLFLIGSDGNVYLRYMDETTWRWKNCQFPYALETNAETQKQKQGNHREEVCIDISFSESSLNAEKLSSPNKNCDPKVASIRPIPLSENSAIFELQDGRLAELQRTNEQSWEWSRIIGTPTSSCSDNYWIAFASEN